MDEGRTGCWTSDGGSGKQWMTKRRCKGGHRWMIPEARAVGRVMEDPGRQWMTAMEMIPVDETSNH